MSLNGRVAVITGAGRGIGFAAAQLFISEGAKVFLSDLNLAEARATLKDLGGDVVGFLETDVTKEEQVEAMCRAALKQFGQVDAVIINAGVSSPIKPWLECGPSDVDQMMNVNVKGSWLTAKHAVKAMLDSPHKGQGAALVFVASVASLYGEIGLSPYTASKWAVRGLSLTAAREFAPYGIRSNCVQPGATDTAMVRHLPSRPPDGGRGVHSPAKDCRAEGNRRSHGLPRQHKVVVHERIHSRSPWRQQPT